MAMTPVAVPVDGESFEVLTAGDPDAPLLLLLHGFPEHAGAWTEMAERLSDRFFCVAPNQRGYGRSPRPADVESYKAGRLVADAVAILDHFRGDAPAHAVIGHDWGASVAYALAFQAPHRLERLVIGNGVHPIPFQRALASGGPQAAASQYIEWLRAEGSEDALAADDHAKLLTFFAEGMDMSWLTPERAEEYRAAWRGPNGLRGMVNWYRATPLVVAKPGEPAEAPLLALPDGLFRVPMPHLLLWGDGDRALLPEATEGLEAFCDDLRRVDVPGADHWLFHQKPDEIAESLRAFL